MGKIDTLVKAVGTRLNQRSAVHSFLWAFLIAAAGLLAVGAVYLFQGYAVPRMLYGVALALAVAGGVASALARRVSREDASRFADEFFQLKDAITSNNRFEKEHKEGGFYELQRASTERDTAELTAERIPRNIPRKLVVGSVLLVAVAGLTAFKGPSEAVILRLQQEAETLVKTEAIKKALEEAIEEMRRSTDDPEELAALNSEEIKKMLDNLKATKDMKAALRQMAEIEKHVNETAKKTEVQKKEEQLLKKAGEELEKEEDPDARELGKKLKQEQFKDAKKKLEEMKPDAEGKTPEEDKKEIAKLRAASKRMAAAARQQKKSTSKKSNGEQNNEEMEDSEEMEEDSLQEDLEKLEEETAELEEAMEQNKGEKCEQCKNKVGERLDKLGNRMAKLGAKKAAQSKLMSLSKKLGQCQNFCQGQSDVPFWMQKPGGLKPGTGTVNSRREEKDELKDNGQYAQIKGQKNEGPSFRKVEDAEDGTGVSHRTADGAGERNFSRQFESFINREDVPEEVKEGVKSYFEALHETARQAAPGPGAPEAEQK